MAQKTVTTSLLSLNEHCLLEMFKFLELTDLVNLAQTYEQLKLLCARIWAKKYKKIEVEIDDYDGMDKKEFSNILSVIGKHISSVSVDGANQLILQLIKDNCKNLISIEMWYSNESIELQGFENLKILKLNAVPISTNELKSCFANNAELECLEFDCSYGEDFLELVDMLPKLQSLHLHNVPHLIHLNQHLHCLDGLTKFTFNSLENCNQLLKELTKNPKLKELHIWMPLDADTFNIIESFPSLEVIAMHQFGHKENLPENIVFPSTLKSVKVTGVNISSKALLSAVRQNSSLDEFDLGSQYDFDESLQFNDRTAITQIEEGLKAELVRRERPLSIIYNDCHAVNKERYIYRSRKLHIINSYTADDRSESQVFTVALPM